MDAGVGRGCIKPVLVEFGVTGYREIFSAAAENFVKSLNKGSGPSSTVDPSQIMLLNVKGRLVP